MFFDVQEGRRAWGNPDNEQFRKAVKRLAVANSWAATLVGILAIISLVLLLVFVVLMVVTGGYTSPTLFLFCLSVVSVCVASYLGRGRKTAANTVKDALDNHRVIVVASDAYRLLEMALFRTYRLELLDLLVGEDSEHYNSVMTAYARAAGPLQTELDAARNRRDILAVHKKLVTAAESAAGNFAQVHLDQSAVEV